MARASLLSLGPSTTGGTVPGMGLFTEFGLDGAFDNKSSADRRARRGGRTPVPALGVFPNGVETSFALRVARFAGDHWRA